MQFGLAARLPDPARVVDDLVTQALRGADVEERGRQTGQVGGACGRGVLRYVGSVLEGTQQRVPAEQVVAAVPELDPVHLHGRGAVVAVVEHGSHQQLAEQARAALVAHGQGERGAQTAAGAGAGDDDALRVDAEFVRVLGDPQQAGVGVVDLGGIGVFGREPVADRDQGGSDPLGRVEDLVEPGAVVVAEEPAAVQVVERRP